MASGRDKNFVFTTARSLFRRRASRTGSNVSLRIITVQDAYNEDRITYPKKTRDVGGGKYFGEIVYVISNGTPDSISRVPVSITDFQRDNKKEKKERR